MLRPANPPLQPAEPLGAYVADWGHDSDRLAAVCTAGTVPHIDLETTGLDPSEPTLRIVGVGVAGPGGSLYLDVRAAPPEWWQSFFGWLHQRGGLWAFNAGFDYSWLLRQALEVGVPPPPLAGCTHVLFRMLATEGYWGQRWGLETAQLDVLGWPDSNKADLEQALVKHGLVTKAGSADKGQMWQLAELEPELFGRYCALDALASYQLAEVLGPQARDSTVWRFVTQEWATAIQLKCEAQLAGILVDLPRLTRYHEQLKLNIAAGEQRLRAHPRLAPHIQELEQQRAATFFAPHITHRKLRPTKAEFAADPEAYPDRDPAGDKHPTWQRVLGGRPYRLEVVSTPRNVDRQAPAFNWESDADVRWLLYERVYPTWTKAEGKLRLEVEDGRIVEVGLTGTGLAPCGRDVLPALGDIGRLLTEVNELTKLEGYVRAYVAAAERAGGRLHLNLRAHGTATGRWSGGGDVGAGGVRINPQQFPGDPEVLGSFGADPGHVLIDSDINSLEPRVMAYFSQDPTMLELFASGKPHDVYLYVAAALFPDKRDAIDSLYHLDAPTTESVAAAKAAFKAERSITKVIHLASSYGAGPGKIYGTLMLAGISITFEEVRAMHRRYWELFGGIRRWEQRLRQERDERGGWIYNAHGRPMAVPDHRLKDILNIFVQSSGHDCLLTLSWYLDRTRRLRAIDMRPWMPDMHDQLTWQVLDTPQTRGLAEQAVLDAYESLNRDLCATVAISGAVDFGTNFWEFKG